MSYNIIGRDYEKNQLKIAVASKEAEFIALYGRRRVGKTFLIREYFKNQKQCVFFHITGIKKAKKKEQLEEFKKIVEDVFYAHLKGTQLTIPTSWRNAFEVLTDAINNFIQLFRSKKVVLFFDEFPWLATKKSGILSALDYYWNRYWSANPKIKLIVCGSAASWMIKNLLHATDGLYNRVTCRLRLEPFSLREAKEYLRSKTLYLTEHQILQLYMCIGGIPYYLRRVQKGLSAIQNVNEMCFKRKGSLLDEFELLFSSLFDNSEAYEEIIKIIATKHYGIDRKEIEKKCKLSAKGRVLTQRLKVLEESDFIASFIPWGKRKGKYYKITDEYTLFYLTWIAPQADSRITKSINEKFWEKISQTQKWKSWAGYAFESICYKHLRNIRKALQIPSGSTATTWKYTTKRKDEDGAQIDLLFDRSDNAINICEIKYCAKSYEIDKQYARMLTKKCNVYEKITGDQRQIFLSMITSCRLKKNMYSQELIASEVVLQDLFK